MMVQHYKEYTKEDHEVWSILFNRQQTNLADKACNEYLECLEKLSPVLNANAIPNFDQLSAALTHNTGWQIEIVPGMIPVNAFFELLAQKKFCSSTWVRSKKNLDYLDEPDIFHDIFGHIPLLINPTFSKFAHAFGELGVKYKDYPKIVDQLQRLYWFTIEFGAIQVAGETKMYGAGIISSYSETLHVLNSNTSILSFHLETVLNHVFINTEIQQTYYSIDSLDDLFQLIPQLNQHFEKLIGE